MLQLGIMYFISLMDHILFQPSKVTLNILLKKDETAADNSPTQIHTNKFKN